MPRFLVDLLIRHQTWVLVFVTLLTVLASIPAQKITFDRRIDRMFAADDPLFRSYQDLKEWFGASETCFVGYDDPQLFSVEGLRRLELLHRKLESTPGVRRVTSLKSVRRPSAPLDPRTFSQQLAANTITPDELRDEILQSRLYGGRLVSESGETPILIVELAPHLIRRMPVLPAIRQVCAESQPPAMVIGEPVLVDEVFTTLERDGVLLGVASSLILTLVIGVIFQNLRWILLPFAVVQATLIWTKALLVISNMQLSMVSSPLVALVTVIGVATLVHIAVRFRDERTRSNTHQALTVTLMKIVPAIFWSCATTMAGFAALTVTKVLPVRDFGIMMSIGAGLVFVAAMLIVPPFVLLFPRLGDRPATAIGEVRLRGMLNRLATGIDRHPWAVLASVAILFLLVGLGISRLEMATDFNDNFRKDSPVVRSFDFMASRMQGINAMDVMIELPDDPNPLPSDPGSPNGSGSGSGNGDGNGSGNGKSNRFNDLTQRIRLAQAELEDGDLIAQTMSLPDLLDFVSLKGKENHESQRGFRRLIPQVIDPLAALSDQSKLKLLETVSPTLIGRFWNREAGATRIVVQGRKAPGAHEKQKMVERVEAVADQHFPGSRVTGMFVLMVYLTQSLMRDQWISFAVSMGAIFGLLTIAFRSVKLGVISIIPNIAPILMVLGAMGWLGLKVNMATAMLASVSLGLAVDSGIHYIFRYKQERASGKDHTSAIASVQESVGMAMILSNLALIAGFLVLLMSSLIPTVHFGMLVSVAMVGGLLGNLLLLPLLLKWAAS